MSTVAEASPSNGVNPRVAKIFARWQQALEQNSRNIEQKHWKPTIQTADRVLQRISGSVVSGFERLIGVALAQRAIGHLGLGDERRAKWDLAMAEQYIPELSGKLAAFGPAGLRLKALGDDCDADVDIQPILDSSKEGESLDDVLGYGRRNSFDEETAEPPKKVRGSRPNRPRGARLQGLHAHIIVQMIIGDDGVPSCPVILGEKRYSTLTLDAMETVYDWRFKPARKDNEDVSVHYTLTVNY